MTEQTLSEFVLARIAEDEEAEWARIEAEVQRLRRDGLPTTRRDLLTMESDQWRRPLTEIEAKRRIVDLHPARWIYVEANRKMGEESPQVECVGGPVYDDEVRILGEVYAAHEDYRKEWRMQDTPNPFSIRP